MRRYLACFVALLVLSAACAPQEGVTVELDEYTLESRPANERSGEITFRARNVGAIAHQLLVLETERGFDRLPTKKGVVPLDDDGIEQVGEIPIVAEGETEELAIDLEPGRYTLICNIAGHYENGMRAAFRVSD